MYPKTPLSVWTANRVAEMTVTVQSCPTLTSESLPLRNFASPRAQLNFRSRCSRFGTRAQRKLAATESD